MIGRAGPKRPVVFPVALRNRQVVDAGIAELHQSLVIELPVLVAVGTKPLTAVVVPFVSVTNGDVGCR